LLEGETDHRRRLDHGALLRREEIEARRQEGLDRWRDGEFRKVAGGDPAAGLLPEQAVVDQHREKLFHEEWVAFRRCNDPISCLLRDRRVAEEMPGDQRAFLVGQRFELDHLSVVLQPVGSALEQIRAGGAKQEERRSGRRGGDVLNQVEEGVLRPVDVLEDDDERLPRRLDFEELARTPEHLVQREVGLGQTDRGGDSGDDVLAAGPRELRELGANVLRRVLIADSPGLADDLHERPEGDATAVGKTAAANHPCV